MQSSKVFCGFINHAFKQTFTRKWLFYLSNNGLIDVISKRSVVSNIQLRKFTKPATKEQANIKQSDENQKSESSEKPLDSPVFEGEEKVYPEKLKKLVDEISQLSLLEVADFNDLLKKTLKITDLPVLQASAALASQKEEVEEAAEVKQAKTSFTVRILKFDPAKKVALIKEVKNIVPDMNLVQAKKFVESVPSVVGTDIAKDEAEKLKETLTAVGAFVEIE